MREVVEEASRQLRLFGPNGDHHPAAQNERVLPRHDDPDRGPISQRSIGIGPKDIVADQQASPRDVGNHVGRRRANDRARPTKGLDQTPIRRGAAVCVVEGEEIADPGLCHVVGYDLASVELGPGPQELNEFYAGTRDLMRGTKSRL